MSTSAVEVSSEKIKAM
ncbi:hypothetical protein Gotur_006646 [Gossypium turneri]